MYHFTNRALRLVKYVPFVYIRCAVCDFSSADEIKQRLDSLEASLLSASARTPSEVYTEPHCSTAARATTRMVAPPTQCDMATGMDTAGNVGRRTETVVNIWREMSLLN